MGIVQKFAVSPYSANRKGIFPVPGTGIGGGPEIGFKI